MSVSDVCEPCLATPQMNEIKQKVCAIANAQSFRQTWYASDKGVRMRFYNLQLNVIYLLLYMRVCVFVLVYLLYLSFCDFCFSFFFVILEII